MESGVWGLRLREVGTVCGVGGEGLWREIRFDPSRFLDLCVRDDFDSAH